MNMFRFGFNSIADTDVATEHATLRRRNCYTRRHIAIRSILIRRSELPFWISVGAIALLVLMPPPRQQNRKKLVRGRPTNDKAPFGQPRQTARSLVRSSCIVHPDKPEYQDIVVKVTGYSAHFVLLDREFQKEFVARVNYREI